MRSKRIRLKFIVIGIILGTFYSTVKKTFFFAVLVFNAVVYLHVMRNIAIWVVFWQCERECREIVISMHRGGRDGSRG